MIQPDYQIQPLFEGSVSEDPEPLFPSQRVHQHPLCQQRCGKVRQGWRDLWYTDSTGLLLFFLW